MNIFINKQKNQNSFQFNKMIKINKINFKELLKIFKTIRIFTKGF